MDNSSLLEVATTFASKEFCLAHIAKKRWPDGNVICPLCSYPKAYVIKNKGYKCADCRKEFSAV
jgi:hypothetical protein